MRWFMASKELSCEDPNADLRQRAAHDVRPPAVGLIPVAEHRENAERRFQSREGRN